MLTDWCTKQSSTQLSDQTRYRQYSTIFVTIKLPESTILYGIMCKEILTRLLRKYKFFHNQNSFFKNLQNRRNYYSWNIISGNVSFHDEWSATGGILFSNQIKINFPNTFSFSNSTQHTPKHSHQCQPLFNFLPHKFTKGFISWENFAPTVLGYCKARNNWKLIFDKFEALFKLAPF